MKKQIKKIARTIQREIRAIFNIFRHLTNAPLIHFRLNYHSENGEDGVLAEILRRMKIKRGSVVEFGAWDGIYASNTFRLVDKKGFSAVYIEGDEKRFKDLEATAKKTAGRITPIRAFVEKSGENSLDALLAKTSLPKDFDVLSVDIDSFDYQIWESFKTFTPKIVIIEINASIPLGTRHVHGQPGYRGSSFDSMLSLGWAKGYTCVLHIGNMFFIRNDLVSQVIKTPLSEKEQRALFRFKK